MNRIDRISAILIHLQSRRIVKAQDIAERFEISLRTVYRDIRTLIEAGIPIIGEAGVGYSIMDGYRLPPIMFTKEEALSFLTAEKLVENLTDAASGSNFKSALYKIKAVLRSSEKDYLEHIDGQIEVLKSRTQVKDNAHLNQVQTILKGIAERKVISIHYFSKYKEEQTERQIEPVGIFLMEKHWHVIAFCRTRKDYRDFRIDRISNINLTEEKFEKEHPPLKDYLNRICTEMELKPVIIRVEKDTAKYLEEQKYYYGFVSERKVGNYTEMTFLTYSLESFSRWYLMFAIKAEIVQPEELSSTVKSLITEISSKIFKTSDTLLT